MVMRRGHIRPLYKHFQEKLRGNFILAAAVVQRAEISIESILNPCTSAWNRQSPKHTMLQTSCFSDVIEVYCLMELT